MHKPFHFNEIFDSAFWHGLGLSALSTIAQISEIIVLYLILRVGLRRLVSRVLIPAVLHTGEMDGVHAARLKTLAGLLNSIVSYVLTFVFAVMLLRAFHLDPIPLLTTASVMGLAVGFGAQKLVKDVIGGFFILLENQYAMGDYVTIGAVTGTVEEVGMRTTRIRDDVGKLYILSNGDITQVCNQSRGVVATYIEIGLAVGADIDKATAIINKAGKELSDARPELDLIQPPSVQGLSAIDAGKITLRIGCATDKPAQLTDAQIALRGLAHTRLVEAEVALA